MRDLLTILVDLDGVVADFDAKFYRRCAEEGWEMHSSLETQCHRFATDCIPNLGERAKARRMVDTEPGWFRDLPVIDGAVEGLHALAGRAEVWLCSKPLEAQATCRDDKAAWVVEHLGAEWERRLILAADKSMVRGDILLDDAPHPEWFGRASWVPVIYPAPWNGEGSKWEGLPRWRWGDPFEALRATAAWLR